MVRAAIPVRGQSKSPKGGAAAAPSLPARAPSEGPKESPKVPSSFSLPPWYIFLSGVVQLFVASGVLHGFPSFRQMLLAEGYKRSLCPEEDELCDDRSRELLSIYTNSVVPATLGFLLAGFALPVLGPRFCNLLSLALHLVAHALMGMSGEDPEGIVPNRDWMASGYAVLGFSGAALQITTVHCADLYPQRKKYFLSILAGVFQLAAIQFALMNLVRVTFDVPRPVTHAIWMGIVAILMVNCLIVMPDQPFSDSKGLKKGKKSETKGTRGKDKQTVGSAMKTHAFWQFAFHQSANLAVFVFFGGTYPELLSKVDPDNKWGELVALLIPISPLVMSSIVATMQESLGVSRCSLAMTVAEVGMLLLASLSVTRGSLALMFLACAFFVFGRPLMNSLFYTMLASPHFDPDLFSRLFGISSVMAGVSTSRFAAYFRGLAASDGWSLDKVYCLIGTLCLLNLTSVAFDWTKRAKVSAGPIGGAEGEELGSVVEQKEGGSDAGSSVRRSARLRAAKVNSPQR